MQLYLPRSTPLPASPRIPRLARTVGTNNGKLSYSTTFETTENPLSEGGAWVGGIGVYWKNTIGDVQPDVARMKRGHDYYVGQGYRLKFGNYGYGHINVPLSWGENVDMDYWLTLSGHTK